MSNKDKWDKIAIIGQGVIAFGWVCLSIFVIGAFVFNWW